MIEMIDKTQQDFAKVEKFKQEVINPVFPNARFASSAMMSLADEPASDFKGKLVANKLFDGTAYEYKGAGKFIHYTSLFAIKAILESGYIRMSEFGNLIDKKELLYASKVFENNPIFKFNSEKLEQLKENIFCLSLCQSNEKTKRNDYMWEVYGDKGKGVVIELEFTNIKPYYFLFGQVQYGNMALQPLRKIKKLATQFYNKNDGFFSNNFLEFLLEMQSFHKTNRYQLEEEVRLFMKCEKPQYTEHKLKTIYKDINKNQEVKYFNKIYLKERQSLLDIKKDSSLNKVNLFPEFPQIEIKNIILGYNLSVPQKVNLSNLFCTIKSNHSYNYKISQLHEEGFIREMDPPCNIAIKEG